MNKTNYSFSSYNSKKPENYRVVYKTRNNRYDDTSELRHSASFLNEELNKISNNEMIGKQQNKDGMKNYVKNKMKTQYQQNRIKNSYQQKMRVSRQRKANTPILKISQTAQPQNNIRLNLQKIKHKTQIINNQDKNLIKIANQQQKKQQKSSIKPIQILQNLQKRITSLLSQRLHQCQQFKTQRNTIVQNELQSLIQNIKDVKNRKQGTSPQPIENEIEYYNKKIKMIQTIMAQSMIESQILKKDLMSKLSNKIKHKKLNTESSIAYNLRQTYKADIQVQPQDITKRSINQQSYVMPNKLAYNIYKYKNIFFNADRHKQPLPRSSYNRQFLKQVPKPDKEYLPMNNQFMGGRSLSSKFLNSRYKEDFGPKSAEKINIKELNACKNKIKNIDIIFHQRTKSHTNQPLFYNAEKLNKFQPKVQKPNAKIPETTQLNMPKNYLLSESRRQYKGKSYSNIKAEIKHSFLQKLRYQFKQNVHA